MRFAEMVHGAFGFGSKELILYHSRKAKDGAPSWMEYESDLMKFLGRVDVVSVHIALKRETEGFLGERELRGMKKGGILINTARGKVVDEEALIRVLEDGHVSPRFPSPMIRFLRLLLSNSHLSAALRSRSRRLPLRTKHKPNLTHVPQRHSPPTYGYRN